MTSPPDPVMLFLLAVHCGQPVSVQDSSIVVTCDSTAGGVTSVVVPCADLAELEDRGWLEIGEHGPAVTERGRYWLDKWARAKFRGRLG